MNENEKCVEPSTFNESPKGLQKLNSSEALCGNLAKSLKNRPYKSNVSTAAESNSIEKFKSNDDEEYNNIVKRMYRYPRPNADIRAKYANGIKSYEELKAEALKEIRESQTDSGSR